VAGYLGDMGAPAMGTPPFVSPMLAPPANAFGDAPLRVEMSYFDAAVESLFGDAYAPGQWRPLSLGSFFSEGWREPWVGGPAGVNGTTPRHGWLGGFEGVFYRLWLTPFTYRNNLSKPYSGEQYAGNFVIFLPLNRRFELAFNVPYVIANGTEDPNRGHRSDFGDLTVGTRFLMSESEALTQTFNLDIRTPTGQVETGNNVMALTPRYEMWANPFGSWVLRGGAGINVPLNKNDQRPGPIPQPGGGFGFGRSTSQTAFTGGMALGRYFTPHDVPFGDLVLYVNTNFIVPLEDGGEPTYVGVGPGTRFHIANNYFFLSYAEVPVVGPRPYDYQFQAAILKVF
jgi:hypothetical protein